MMKKNIVNHILAVDLEGFLYPPSSDEFYKETPLEDYNKQHGYYLEEFLEALCETKNVVRRANNAIDHRGHRVTPIFYLDIENINRDRWDENEGNIKYYKNLLNNLFGCYMDTLDVAVDKIQSILKVEYTSQNNIIFAIYGSDDQKQKANIVKKMGLMGTPVTIDSFITFGDNADCNDEVIGSAEAEIFKLLKDFYKKYDEVNKN